MSDTRCALPFKFGGLEDEFSSLENSLFVVVGVPYDQTTTYQAGTRRGPLAIVDASTHLEWFDEELQGETYRCGIHTWPLLEITAAGPEAMCKGVYEVWRKILGKGKISVMLGGDHSISCGAVQAAKERCKDLNVLQLDAHCDLRDSYLGTRFNHACVARRMLEMAPVTQVGIRSLSLEEYEFLKTKPKGLKTFFAHEMRAKQPTPKEICKDLRGDLYISVDLDCLDPSIMPATGTPEPGGLLWEETLAILRQAVRQCHVVGFDVTELCPLPGIVAPDFLTAKLVYRMMGYVVESGKSAAPKCRAARADTVRRKTQI